MVTRSASTHIVKNTHARTHARRVNTYIVRSMDISRGLGISNYEKNGQQ
jgi:hypothetical protein